ncbi:hypothetical protein NLJ89_g5475 [Agrocybe chaxingu]|uniref:Uncharacterized protein n=1 Tax=Agrocybe chaxingu TaxID=84603 RepID=A0A9W8K053_9AGAR|nr:hypothetical protein NLJ89_g5475 [Agrocybe chaxingu]
MSFLLLLYWKNHRQLCTFNQNAKKGIAKAIENGDTLGEIPIREIDPGVFTRTLQAASPLLKTAAMEALEIHTSSECCLTHIVWITVASNLTAGTPKAATPSDAVKYFRVTDGCVCTIDTTPMDITADAREEIIRNQKKALELRESGAALGVLCPSFDARMVERNPLWLQELQFHIARGVGI